ncbi:glycosyltransferase family 2 protein [Dyadobacter sp. CY312]|uniref:glycosyltransferase family 2 protein n=1 Tax=Dyadobacter sp. CY312 TaxID=2907303 RepID=UPI001F48F3F6|nr:glycosyltransferase family A protein [Dyadobacter sp. CY312]MCE7042852.1 glycosyltransferase family 2 protein [Dyadobacter sp. CY312]
MHPPKLSIVIPTYRRVTLLRRVLEAIQAQTFPLQDYEVIIVSDGPDELTEALAKEMMQNDFGPHTRFYSLPKKQGPAAARNAGWRMSEGELIVFTDDDCIPESDWLQAYHNAYNLHEKDSPVCFTGKVYVPVRPFPTDYEKNVANLSTAEFITANCACNREALTMVNGFDEEFPIAWREDSDLQFKFLRSGIYIIHVPDAITCHPVREAHWGVSITDQRKSMFNALLFKKHPDLYKKRISSGPVWSYYLIIFLSLVSVCALLIGATTIFLISLAGWALLIASFIVHRLRGTDSSFSHRLEMVVTSLVIPYLSVYWTLRGSWKYKVFFL